MNQLQKEYFLSVARTGSIGRSAYELYVSSSAISKQISALENELGCILFSRSAKGSVLTPAGELFYKYFIDEDARFLNTLKSAHAVSRADEPVISFGISREWDLAHKLNDLQEHILSLTGASAINKLMDTDTMCHLLENAGIDMVLCPKVMLEKLQNVESLDIAEIHYILLYSAVHPAAEKEKAEPSDFDNCTLVAVRSDKPHFIPFSTSQFLCRKLNIKPLNIFDTINYDTAINCVESGTGFMFTDEWNRVITNTQFRHLVLEDTFTVSLAWNRDYSNPANHGIAEAFRKILKG